MSSSNRMFDTTSQVNSGIAVDSIAEMASPMENRLSRPPHSFFCKANSDPPRQPHFPVHPMPKGVLENI